jgi:hypothetical protein
MAIKGHPWNVPKIAFYAVVSLRASGSNSLICISYLGILDGDFTGPTRFTQLFDIEMYTLTDYLLNCNAFAIGIIMSLYGIVEFVVYTTQTGLPGFFVNVCSAASGS